MLVEFVQFFSFFVKRGDHMKSKNTVVEAARELIPDPRFLFRVGKTIENLGVVREVRNRLIIFLACLTMMLKQKVSVLVTGPSGAGKSHLIEVPIKLMPPETVIKRASFSRRAFAFGEGSLENMILYVNEYRGGREAQLLLRILQSEGEIAHEYTVGGKTVVTRRVGSPVVLTTTTEDDIIEDDATRFLTIRIDETSETNAAVFKAAITPGEKSEEPDPKVWQEAIRLLIENYKRPFPFPKWFGYIAEQVPRERVRARRDWKRFLAFMQAIALCRSQADAKREITFSDYCVAYHVLNDSLTATTYALNENELALQKAVGRLYGELGRAVTTKELREHLGWDESMAYKYVRASVKHNLIRYQPGTAEKNVKALLPVPETSGTFLPSPRQVLDNAKELGDSMNYISPLTGKLMTVRRSKKSAV
jgi:energy-coupling factor transporter ATP-binding protein EcfA2